MVNFPSYTLYITMACKCIMHFLHGAGSQYLVDTNNEQVFTLLARPSTIFPLLHRSCDVGDRCAKGGEGQREKKERKTSHGISIYCPFQPTPYSIQQHLMSEIFHIKDSQHGRSRADVCLRCQWKKKKWLNMF